MYLKSNAFRLALCLFMSQILVRPGVLALRQELKGARVMPPRNRLVKSRDDRISNHPWPQCHRNLLLAARVHTRYLVRTW